MRRHWIHHAAGGGFGGHSDQYWYMPGLFDNREGYIGHCYIIASFCYNHHDHACTWQNISSLGGLTNDEVCQALVKLQQQFPVDIDPDLMEGTTDPDLLAVIRENIRLFK